VAHAGGRLNDAVERLERDMIEHGLLRTQGNKSRLARELGISRSNLILKIQKYGLGKPGDVGVDALEDSPGPRA
jgi:two-component system, NtrC family, response regulator HupR/HoxA